MSSLHSHGERSRSRTKVKPILRKLTQSEKNSLDLDRPIAEHDGLGLYEYGMASRSSHDIGFVQTSRRGYHQRSASGTSQFSTATTGSGHRGNFVHPFQQTPRPYTPPLAASYQNSLRESEGNSPTVEEDEIQLQPHSFRSPSNLSNRTTSLTQTTSHSSPAIPQPPTLRIQTKPSSSRLALATSHTSLHHINSDVVSPTDTMSPISVMRGSIDKGFRMRSHSENDPDLSIRELRRKFQEKEDAKEEKFVREEVKALERRQQKEAREYERAARRSSISESKRSSKKRSKSDLTMQQSQNEKTEGFYGRGYDSVPVLNPPITGDVAGPEIERRTNTAKARTHGAWTKFVMWLRTRFLRMRKQ